MKEEIRKIQDEELENVSGGDCHQTFSDQSYAEMGCTELYDGQVPDNHPLLVSCLNSCSRGSFGGATFEYCEACTKKGPHHAGGMTIYCAARSKELNA